ncbi:hypothetical protein M569_16818 [Genlisea aurea]|uniref:TF-B3 domain-containing protein n=1 Tax=Genlisea aurea TaxID=192259 RepID=S8BUE5_9LAMI|nr:hypothetical protein M569_16818 [Genlisea aurea]
MGLRIGTRDAYGLTGGDVMTLDPLKPFAKTITVYDSSEKKYSIIVTNHPVNKYTLNFRLAGVGWSRLVVDHELSGGDKVSLYKINERDEEGNFCYLVRFDVKSTDDECETSQ